MAKRNETVAHLTIHVGTPDYDGNLTGLGWAVAAGYGGTHHPMFAHIATPADQLNDYYQTPEITETGPVCGMCTEATMDYLPGVQARHATIEHVRQCCSTNWQLKADSEAEYAADIAIERHFEDRGYWDAIAQEEWERAQGVIPFDMAMRDAMGPEWVSASEWEDRQPAPLPGYWDVIYAEEKRLAA